MGRKKHSFRLCTGVLQLVIFIAFMTVGTLSKEDDVEEGHLRKSRSIKDFIPRGEPLSRTILDLRTKIVSLDSSVKNISEHVSSVDTKLDKISVQESSVDAKIQRISEQISQQTKSFQESFLQQLGITTQLKEEVTSLKQVLAGHSEILGDLEKLASSSDKLYALSNQTCGGVLIGQAGSIHFSSSAFENMGANFRLPSSCIWTIRANSRKSLKIQTFSPHTYRSVHSTSHLNHPHAYLAEVLPKKDDNQTTNTSTNLQIKLTKLEKNMHYVCNGPVVFVVYMLYYGSYTFSYSSSSSTSTTLPPVPPLEVYFEGVGKVIKNTTFFSHEHLLENSGSFNSDQMVLSDDQYEIENNITYSMDYTSIVISNFSTKAYLQASIDNETCADKETHFIVITNLLDGNDTAFVDCCRQSCMGKNSLVNYDSPFVILIRKKFKADLNFNLTWTSETPYPSSSGLAGVSNDYQCGGVVGGTNGVISYKPYRYYKNGERCIWTIVPQPRRSSITIYTTYYGLESTYDHLYMMELTDKNGVALATGPRMTDIDITRGLVNTTNSSELHIVFYTDSTITGQGFTLTWRATGDLVRTRLHVTKQFTILKDETGSMTSLRERPMLARNMYQVFILTPITPSASVYEMQLAIDQMWPTTAPTNSSSCLHQDIALYTSYNGRFNQMDMAKFCNDTNQSQSVGQIETEAMAIIVLTDSSSSPDSPLVALNLSWQEDYGKVQKGYLTIDDNECGGVIKGNRGVLNYKLEESYLNNARCIWLLQTPNHTNIKLELKKDGLESCCDLIVVFTIDPSTGTLRNESTIFNRANNTETFNDESLLVITFQSDGSTSGRGFSLQFTGTGDADQSPEYSYQLHHQNEKTGTIMYPSSEWEDPVLGTKEIIVISSSNEGSDGQGSMAVTATVTWTSGIFKRDNDDGMGDNVEDGSCTYESMTFYGNVSRHNGWLSTKRFPNQEEVNSCISEIDESNSREIFSKASEFLAIYRHIPTTTIIAEDSNETTSSMEFSFQHTSTCGGVIIGDSGEISYKEEGKYSNLEKCVWLVQAPQARTIRFTLVRDDFESCCDLLYIYSFTRHGIPVTSAILKSRSNRDSDAVYTAIVDGPVAIVVFTSDSSVNGNGFRFSYSTVMTATEPFPYTFHLAHGHESRRNRFSFPMEDNQIAVAAVSMERPSSRSFMINVTALRPQVAEGRGLRGNECLSDTLNFYNVLGRSDRLNSIKTLNAKNVNGFNDSQCNPLENSDFNNCSRSISHCTDPPSDNYVRFNGTALVAVYKSVNSSTTGDLQYRGLAMVVNDGRATSNVPTLSSGSRYLG